MQTYVTCDFFANTFVCTVMTDLLTQYYWKLLCLYVLRWRISQIIDFFSKLLLVVANLCNFHLFANKCVCTVLTDLLTRFCWKLMNMYVLWWCMSKGTDFLKFTIGSCKLMQLAIFCKYISVHGFDWSNNPSLLKKKWYTCTFYDDACLK